MLQALDFPGDIRSMDEVDVFLRKIERRFDEHPELHQSVEKRVDLAREFADQAARCRANAGGRRGADEIGHRFGLSEVDLVVEKRALGELTRLGKARAEIEAALQHQRQNGRAAVSLQLENVFARVRRRRGEE